MKPSLSSDSAGMVRDLLRSSRQGALATLMADSGAPYCSLVNVAPDADGAPLPGTSGVGIGALAIGGVKFRTQHVMMQRLHDAEKALAFDFRDAYRVARDLVG